MLRRIFGKSIKNQSVNINAPSFSSAVLGPPPVFPEQESVEYALAGNQFLYEPSYLFIEGYSSKKIPVYVAQIIIDTIKTSSFASLVTDVNPALFIFHEAASLLLSLDSATLTTIKRNLREFAVKEQQTYSPKGIVRSFAAIRAINCLTSLSFLTTEEASKISSYDYDIEMDCNCIDKPLRRYYLIEELHKALDAQIKQLLDTEKRKDILVKELLKEWTHRNDKMSYSIRELQIQSAKYKENPQVKNNYSFVNRSSSESKEPVSLVDNEEDNNGFFYAIYDQIQRLPREIIPFLKDNKDLKVTPELIKQTMFSGLEEYMTNYGFRKIDMSTLQRVARRTLGVKFTINSNGCDIHGSLDDVTELTLYYDGMQYSSMFHNLVDDLMQRRKNISPSRLLLFSQADTAIKNNSVKLSSTLPDWITKF